MSPPRKLAMTMISLACFLLLPSLGNIEAYGKINIEIEHNGTDSIGRKLVHQIKEKIGASYVFRLTFNDEPKGIKMIINTAEPELAKEDICVYSIILTLKSKGQNFPLYIWSDVGICKSNRIEEEADEIISVTDKVISAYSKIFGIKR